MAVFGVGVSSRLGVVAFNHHAPPDFLSHLIPLPLLECMGSEPSGVLFDVGSVFEVIRVWPCNVVGKVRYFSPWDQQGQD